MEKGSIEQRGNSYRVRVSYFDLNGKRRQLTKTAGSLPKAEILREKLIQEVEKGIFTKPSKMTLEQYLNEWLYGYVRVTVSPRTQELYRYISRVHLIPAIGNIRLCNLRPQHIQQLYSDKLQQGLSARTVQLHHVTLHKAFENAVRTGLIPNNPCKQVDIPKIERHEMKIMSENDIARFLSEARKTEYYTLFYCYLFTGMRRGEALALRWGDIDLLGCQISINRGMQYLYNADKNKRISFKAPKTSASRRVISLTPSTCVVLKMHKEAVNELRQKLGQQLSDDDLVFCQLNGKPYLPCTISHAWSKLVRRCGLRGVRLHDARHTHASLMLKSGTNLKVIQERLGHSSYNMTANLYAHVMPGMQKTAAIKFDDLVINGNGDHLVTINK